jgi:hypothetical protein
MVAGKYAGRASLYRVEDALYLDGVDIGENAPGVATVYGRRSAVGGGMIADDVNASLAASTSLAFQDAVVRAFEKRGIAITIR